jgi:hypothetical protein
MITLRAPLFYPHSFTPLLGGVRQVLSQQQHHVVSIFYVITNNLTGPTPFCGAAKAAPLRFAAPAKPAPSWFGGGGYLCFCDSRWGTWLTCRALATQAARHKWGGQARGVPSEARVSTSEREGRRATLRSRSKARKMQRPKSLGPKRTEAPATVTRPQKTVSQNDAPRQLCSPIS